MRWYILGPIPSPPTTTYIHTYGMYNLRYLFTNFEDPSCWLLKYLTFRSPPFSVKGEKREFLLGLRLWLLFSPRASWFMGPPYHFLLWDLYGNFYDFDFLAPTCKWKLRPPSVPCQYWSPLLRKSVTCLEKSIFHLHFPKITIKHPYLFQCFRKM